MAARGRGATSTARNLCNICSQLVARHSQTFCTGVYQTLCHTQPIVTSSHVANVAMAASTTNGFLNSVALIAANSSMAHSSVDHGIGCKSTSALGKMAVRFPTIPLVASPAQLTCASKSTPGVIPQKRRSSATTALPHQLLTTSSDSSCSDDLVIDVERLDTHDITSTPGDGKDNSAPQKHKLENISLPQTSAASTAGIVFPTTSPTGAKRLKLTCHGVTTYRSLDGDVLAQAFEAPCKTPRQDCESFKENRRSTASASASDKQSIDVAVVASAAASFSSVESVTTNGTASTINAIATTPTTSVAGSSSRPTTGNNNGVRSQKRSQNTSAKMENLHLHLARIAKGKTLQQQQTVAEAAQSPGTSQVASDKNVDQLAIASNHFACNSSNLLTTISASPSSSSSSVANVTDFNFNLTPAHVGYKSPIFSQTTSGLKAAKDFEEEPIELTTGRKEQSIELSTATVSVAKSVVGEAATVASVESFEGPLELTTQLVKERQKHLQKLSSSPSP